MIRKYKLLAWYDRGEKRTRRDSVKWSFITSISHYRTIRTRRKVLRMATTRRFRQSFRRITLLGGRCGWTSHNRYWREANGCSPSGLTSKFPVRLLNFVRGASQGLACGLECICYTFNTFFLQLYLDLLKVVVNFLGASRVQNRNYKVQMVYYATPYSRTSKLYERLSKVKTIIIISYIYIYIYNMRYNIIYT